MRRRRAPSVVVATLAGTLLSPLSASPAAAAITGSYFDCQANRIETVAPSYQFTGVGSDLTIWWVPEYYRWTGSEWVMDAGGEYHYNLQGGAPHAWQRHPDGSAGGSQGVTGPSGYYAVLNWVYAEGAWHWAWAQNSDLTSGPQPQSTYWCTR